MSRPVRILLRLLAAGTLLLLLAGVAGILVLSSDWFKNKVRERIITEVETASGGKVEIGKFDYDWKQLTAWVRPFVLHGTEPAGAAPLLQADSLQVGLKIISALKRDVDIASLIVDRPRVNVLVDAQGNTNFPRPKVQQKSGKDPIETLLNLKVGEFQIRNGDIRFAEQAMPLEAHGKDLNARIAYDFTGPRYKGDIGFGALQVLTKNTAPLNLDVKLAVAIEKGRLDLTSGRIALQNSSVDLNGSVVDFKDPKATLHLKGNLLLAELAPQLKLPPAKGSATVDADASYHAPEGAQVRATVQGQDVSIRQSGTDFLGNVLLTANGVIHSGSDYQFEGKVNGSQITIREPGLTARNVRVDSAYRLSPKNLELSSTNLAALGGSFAGKASIGLVGRRDFHIAGNLSGFSLQELAQLQGLKGVPYSGSITGPVTIDGVLPSGGVRGVSAQARLSITPQTNGLPLQGNLDVTYDQGAQQLRLGNSRLLLPNSQLTLSGTLGQYLVISLRTKNLDDLKPAVALATGKPVPPLPIALQGGTLALDATVQGALKNPQVDGTLTVDRFAVEGKPVDSLRTSFQANRFALKIPSVEARQGTATVAGNGSLALREWQVADQGTVQADLTISNANLKQLLTDAGSPVPVAGTLSASVKVSGTAAAPDATAQITVDRLSAYDERFDRMTATIRYDGGTVDVADGIVRLGESRLQFKADYRHPLKDFKNGRVTFNLNSNGFNLSQFANARKYREGLAGDFNLQAGGDANVKNGEFLLTTLNGQVGLRNLTIDQRAIGNVVVDAKTNGENLVVGAAGDLRGTQLAGNANVQLAGDYQGSGQLQLSQLTFSRFQDLMVMAGQTSALPFDGVVQGLVKFNGPLRKPELVQARLELPKLEIRPVQRVPVAGLSTDDLTLRNVQPVVAEVKGQDLRIVNARFTAKDTNLEAQGMLSLNPKTQWDLRVNGGLNLAVLQSFNADLLASGVSTLNATVRGTLQQPLVDGKLELKNASMNLVDVSNGIENANGVIRFDRNRATIQELTAQSGGGKVKLAGYVQFGGQEMVYRLQSNAQQVRVRNEGVSLTVDANLNLTGTTSRSILSGLVTVRKAGFNQQTDVGGLLASSAKPVPHDPTRNEFLRNLQFDVRVESVPNLQFTTSLTSNVQAEVNLALKGTPDKPVVLGRVLVNEGEVNFFGTKYTINRGEIGFYNPVKIEPVLDLDLQTEARGITVTINFSGSITKLNTSYRSDPPLQSSEIIALLTVGRDPNANPALASSQVVQQSSVFQTGANTLIGQAVANPVSNRLQRFFGVSKLKIDPQLTGVDNTPQARLTIEQQVSQNVTLTFITNLTRSQQQIVRVQYDVNRNFSILAVRDENGIFGIDFQYRRRFR